MIAAEPITDVDTTAADMLVQLDEELNAAGTYLVFAEPYDPGWRYEGAQPRSAMGVTNLFRADGATGGAVAYRPWLHVRAAYAASAAAILVALVLLVSLRVRAGR